VAGLQTESGSMAFGSGSLKIDDGHARDHGRGKNEHR
jgi:hypothetical protein